LGVSGLSSTEWYAILWLSAPVVLLDEALKAVTRHLEDAAPGSWHSQAHRALPAASQA